jgi:cardiolipin synthase A/B
VAKKIRHHVERLYALDDPRFANELSALLGPAFVAGNQHRVLLNCDQIFAPMLAAICNAQKSVTFETYIYWSGDIGGEFADALAERSRKGCGDTALADVDAY